MLCKRGVNANSQEGANQGQPPEEKNVIKYQSGAWPSAA